MFKERKLYRVEIIKECRSYTKYSLLGIRNSSMLDSSLIKSNEYGVIPKGIKGWVVRKWGRLYFSPDVNQEGLEYFTPSEQPHVLIPFKKIINYYKRLGLEEKE